MAAYLSAFGGKEAETLAGMGSGTPSSVPIGVSGTNAIIAEAYFRAAQDVSTPKDPVLARELQSVVWSAAQSTFPTPEKQGTRNKALRGETNQRVTRAEVDHLLTTGTREGMRRLGSAPLWQFYARQRGEGILTLDEIRRAVRIDAGLYRPQPWKDAKIAPPQDEIRVPVSPESERQGGVSSVIFVSWLYF